MHLQGWYAKLSWLHEPRKGVNRRSVGVNLGVCSAKPVYNFRFGWLCCSVWAVIHRVGSRLSHAPCLIMYCEPENSQAERDKYNLCTPQNNKILHLLHPHKHVHPQSLCCCLDSLHPWSRLGQPCAVSGPRSQDFCSPFPPRFGQGRRHRHPAHCCECLPGGNQAGP